eukprot:scaffold143369_cov19-Tisochrysis_lutea.AAC.4
MVLWPLNSDGCGHRGVLDDCGTEVTMVGGGIVVCSHLCFCVPPCEHYDMSQSWVTYLCGLNLRTPCEPS